MRRASGGRRGRAAVGEGRAFRTLGRGCGGVSRRRRPAACVFVFSWRPLGRRPALGGVGLWVHGAGWARGAGQSQGGRSEAARTQRRVWASRERAWAGPWPPRAAEVAVPANRNPAAPGRLCYCLVPSGFLASGLASSSRPPGSLGSLDLMEVGGRGVPPTAWGSLRLRGGPSDCVGSLRLQGSLRLPGVPPAAGVSLRLRGFPPTAWGPSDCLGSLRLRGCPSGCLGSLRLHGFPPAAWGPSSCVCGGSLRLRGCPSDCVGVPLTAWVLFGCGGSLRLRGFLRLCVGSLRLRGFSPAAWVLFGCVGVPQAAWVPSDCGGPSPFPSEHPTAVSSPGWGRARTRAPPSGVCNLLLSLQAGQEGLSKPGFPGSPFSEPRPWPLPFQRKPGEVRPSSAWLTASFWSPGSVLIKCPQSSQETCNQDQIGCLPSVAP
ncbi:uncharacterized protein LOC121169315 [Ochotona curzoniae]|uniref:uncharacterized protein LOC121169315 n=1 Tax=Ochotona curzoniae TaxID=130825 RepID=UPI001B345EC0|nr:uncharacterized protein LOC121169315 [Ochotona curzoniae]